MRYEVGISVFLLNKSEKSVNTKKIGINGRSAICAFSIKIHSVVWSDRPVKTVHTIVDLHIFYENMFNSILFIILLFVVLGLQHYPSSNRFIYICSFRITTVFHVMTKTYVVCWDMRAEVGQASYPSVTESYDNPKWGFGVTGSFKIALSTAFP